MNNPTFVEVGTYQLRKKGQGAEGDVFLSKKTEDGRIIAVLSDGLGSGIKAGVLATLTATMAVKFIAEDFPIRRAASVIMKTLPICRERQISYATFTIVDINTLDQVRIIEYDNPPYVLIRKLGRVEPPKLDIKVKRRVDTSVSPIKRKTAPLPPGVFRDEVMHYSEFSAQPGDRLVMFSDGVPQSGMGTPAHPLGWGNPATHSFIFELVEKQPEISARELARRLVKEAEAKDVYVPKDDITCAVVYFRMPRKLLVLTGPSVEKSRDREIAEIFRSFPGRKVISGGTTATIIARELGASIRISLKDLDPAMPPSSTMEGADLVTEGIITLGKVAELLERPTMVEKYRSSPASRLVELLLDSDQIEFIVGTKINEAHQDPTMPVELEIRRNIVKRIASILEEKYIKEVTLRFI